MHGRYVHATEAIGEWLDLAGFELLASRQATLRRELGEEVVGRVFTARRR